MPGEITRTCFYSAAPFFFFLAPNVSSTVSREIYKERRLGWRDWYVAWSRRRSALLQVECIMLSPHQSRYVQFTGSSGRLADHSISRYHCQRDTFLYCSLRKIIIFFFHKNTNRLKWLVSTSDCLPDVFTLLTMMMNWWYTPKNSCQKQWHHWSH